MMREIYNGPNGEATPTEYTGWSPESPSGGKAPLPLTIEQTCSGCAHILDGNCDHPKSQRTGVKVSDSSPACSQKQLD